MEITEKRIPRDEITTWNAYLRKWTDASNEQIILKNNNNETEHVIPDGGVGAFIHHP